MPLGLSLALGKMSYVGGKVPYSNEKFAYFDGTEYAAVLNGTQIESLTNSAFSTGCTTPLLLQDITLAWGMLMLSQTTLGSGS